MATVFSVLTRASRTYPETCHSERSEESLTFFRGWLPGRMVRDVSTPLNKTVFGTGFGIGSSISRRLALRERT
jgi:hypothetical protein